jgi:hypothetical protein
MLEIIVLYLDNKGDINAKGCVKGSCKVTHV